MATANQIGLTLKSSTGSGNFVGAVSPTFVTPNLGTPSSGTLTNCTGLPGAAFVYLSKQSASTSTSVDFTSLITNTYNIYLLLYVNVFPVTNIDRLYLRVSTNNGSTYATSGYQGGSNYLNYSTTTVTNAQVLTACVLNPGMTNVTSNNGACGHIFLYSLQDGGFPTVSGIGSCFAPTVTNQAVCLMASSAGNNPNSNAIRVLCSSGNIASGDFILYGVRSSN